MIRLKKETLVCLFLLLLLAPFVYADCAEDKTACFEKCNQECNQKKYDYCRKYEYSGCALDVMCDCNKCEFYDSKWCPNEGYMGCAAGPISKYETCIKNCQSDFEQGKDTSNCRNDCNTELNSGLQVCKNAQCQTSCTAQGYEKGEWAPYTSTGGYDSCNCLGEKTTVTEKSETTASAPRKKVGFVKAIMNKKGVRVWRDNKWFLAGVNTPLFPGDRIRTGPDSKVKYILLQPDGTQDIIDIRPNSLFEVPDTYATDKEKTLYETFGSIVATISRRISGEKPNFYVKTPGVVLGIRGTEFFLSYDNVTKESFVMVKEGEVEVEGTTTSLVKSGEQVRAVEGVIGNTEKMDYARWDEITEEEWDEEVSERSYSVIIISILVLVAVAVGYFAYRKFFKKTTI
ncbi:FecR family protein [Candidatus Woesearchaeota archaeon]|nr:FecR family protein [Candidatus Woesearchaeota archaeon]